MKPGSPLAPFPSNGQSFLDELQLFHSLTLTPFIWIGYPRPSHPITEQFINVSVLPDARPLLISSRFSSAAINQTPPCTEEGTQALSLR